MQRNVNPKAFVDSISESLQPLADPARATPMRAYMKNHFNFLGIPTPQRRTAIAPLLKTLKDQPANVLIAIARELWAKPEREFQYAALDLLTRHWRTLDARNLPALLALAKDKSWWDSVDNLGTAVVSPLTVRYNLLPLMNKWNKSDNIWLVRAAIQHQRGRGTKLMFRCYSNIATIMPMNLYFGSPNRLDGRCEISLNLFAPR